jgi:hypothetical protein
LFQLGHETWFGNWIPYCKNAQRNWVGYTGEGRESAVSGAYNKAVQGALSKVMTPHRKGERAQGMSGIHELCREAILIHRQQMAVVLQHHLSVRDSLRTVSCCYSSWLKSTATPSNNTGSYSSTFLFNLT